MQELNSQQSWRVCGYIDVATGNERSDVNAIAKSQCKVGTCMGDVYPGSGGVGELVPLSSDRCPDIWV